MSFDLTGIPIASAVIRPRIFGGLLTPALGGPVQRLDRLGSRYAMAFTTAPMRMEPEGRRWAAMLMRALKEGAICEAPQPDFDVGAPGLPTVATNTASGKVVPITGATPNYTIRMGQWLTIVHGGQRYFDQATEQVILNASGAGSITIQHLLRTPITAGDVVELGIPKIEGWIEDAFEYTLNNDRTTQFQFTVAEAA